MSAARLAPVLDADFEEVGDQRRTDRRASDRRAPRMKLDSLFAATLVNQVAREELVETGRYTQPCRGPRAGIIVNVRV